MAMLQFVASAGIQQRPTIQERLLWSITYTKAAAANMANRDLPGAGRLGDAGRGGARQGAGEADRRAPSPRRSAATARRLFAQALETPGGLKIETIHAFCTRVLQSAPFEANVPPRFEIADDVAQAEMLREARRDLLAQAAADPEGELAQALELLARQAAQDTFDAMMREALRQRALFSDAQGRARDAAGDARRARRLSCGSRPI